MPPFLSTILIKLKLKEVDPLDQGVTQGYAPYEELDGKQTTKLGMIFVVIMVIAGLWQGQVLLHSIQTTINPPENLSSCFSDAVNRSGLSITVSRDYSYSEYGGRQYNGYSSSYAPAYDEGLNRCRYSIIEVERNFPALYDSVRPKIELLSRLNSEVSTANSELWKEKNNKNTQQQNYNTSLFENMSGSERAVYSASTISGTLVVAEDRIAILEKLIASKQSEIRTAQEEIKQTLVQSSLLLESVASDYENDVRFLELKRFLTSFFLLAPLAWFTLRRYFKAKNTRSEFAIIWGGAALIATLLFSQVLVVFVYRILPKRLLAEIAQFLASLIQSFDFLIIIFQWLGFILIPLFFGYLVYKIQKKFYNPLAVSMRSIKDGKCPKCTMKIKDSMVHCPMCSFNLRVSCQSCSSTSVCFAKYCETCGKAIPEQVIVTK